MKRTWLALLVAAGCSSAGGPSPGGNPDTAFEIALISRLALDVTTLRKGEWALYKVTVKGERDSKYVKYAVVDEDRAGIWLENKVPAESGTFVLKSKYDRKGKLLEHWRGEPGSLQPAKLYPSDRKGEPPPVHRDSAGADAKVTEVPDQIQSGGKTYDCTKVTTTLTYPDRRKSTLTDWYSKEVPFSIVMGGKSYGGLVRRQFGLATLELVGHDNKGVMSELQIPK